MLAGFINLLTGTVHVREDSNVVYVTGLSGYVLTQDIKRILETSRISKHVFNRVTGNSFQIFSWFVPDLVTLLEELITNKRLRSNKMTLAKVLDLIKTNTWIADTKLQYPTRLHYHNLNKFKVKPLGHQSSFFEYYDKATTNWKLNGALLNGAVGSGKTLSALFLSELLGYDQVIIVVPKISIDLVWQKTLKERYNREPKYWLSTYNSEPDLHSQFFIIHYEYLNKFIDKVKLFKKPPMVILDESQNFSELSSGRTNLFIKFCNDLKTRDVLYLSGTPLKALTVEFIPLLRVIDPMFTDKVEERFRGIYRGSNDGAVMLIQKRLNIFSHVVEKKVLGLKEPTYHTVQIRMPNGNDYTLDNLRVVMETYSKERTEHYKARYPNDLLFFNHCLDIHQSSLVSKDVPLLKEYKQALEQIKGTASTLNQGEKFKLLNNYEKNNIIPSLPMGYREQFKDVKTLIKYPMLKIRGEVLGNCLGKARIDCHVDMVKHIDFFELLNRTLKKTVVFTPFVEVVETTAVLLTSQKLKPVMVYGKTNNNIFSIVNQFDKDEYTNPLIATYASLNSAVPLTMADSVILIGQPWRPYLLEQAIGRVWRLGANTDVQIYNILLDTQGKPNISTRIEDILKWAKQQVDEILKVTTDVDLEETTVSLEDEHIEVLKQSTFLEW